MPEVVFDIAVRPRPPVFPAHGWAVNTQGVRLLWIPFLELVLQPEAVRKGLGATSTLLPGNRRDVVAAYEVLKHLALTLRELSALTRMAGDTPMAKLSDERYRLHELAPIYIDLAFTYLRRLADRLAIAARTSLFDHVSSAPHSFKELRRFILDDNSSIEGSEPLVDVTELRRLMDRRTAWFDRLRGVDESGKKGIRDPLEHRAVRIIVAETRSGSGPTGLFATMHGSADDIDTAEELTQATRDIIADLCSFLTRLCALVRLEPPYRDDRHFLFIFGDDRDATAFWPAI